jgi:hypothetical protein
MLVQRQPSTSHSAAAAAARSGPAERSFEPAASPPSPRPAIRGAAAGDEGDAGGGSIRRFLAGDSSLALLEEDERRLRPFFGLVSVGSKSSNLHARTHERVVVSAGLHTGTQRRAALDHQLGAVFF